MKKKEVMPNYIDQLKAIKQKLAAWDEFPSITNPPEVYPDKIPEITHLPDEVPDQVPAEHPEPDVPIEQPDEKNSH